MINLLSPTTISLFGTVITIQGMLVGTLGFGGSVDLYFPGGSLEKSQIEAGDDVNIEFQIGNAGTDEADEFLLGYFLSTDSTFSNDDIFLEEEEAEDLDAGDIEDEDEEVTIPADVADGDYFALVVADYTDQIFETDETNNTLALPLQVGAGGGGGQDDAIEIEDAVVEFGSLLDGSVNELTASDDEYFVVQSDFGFLSSEPNIAEIIVTASTDIEEPEAIILSIESRLNNPGGVGSFFLRNFDNDGQGDSGQTFDLIEQYSIGTTETIQSFEITDDAENYVDENTQTIEMKVEYVVIATFTLSGFQASIDHIEGLVSDNE